MKESKLKLTEKWSYLAGINIFFFTLAVTLVFFLVRQHLTSSREFYFWDNIGYYNIATEMLDRFRTVSTLDFLRDLYHSFSDEISNLFALPLLPFLSVLGTSRFDFIISLALCYLLPAVFLTAWLCSVCVDQKRLVIFWGTVFILLLSPFCWAAILDGRPDIGGVGLLLLAILVATHFIFSKAGMLKFVWIGLCLALLPLFRRSFLVTVAAFFIAWAIAELVIERKIGFSIKNAIKKLTGPIIAVIAWGLFILSIGYPFLRRYILNDVMQQYSSYLFVEDRGWKVVSLFTLSFYSAPLLLFSVLGWIGVIKSTSSDRRVLKLAWLALLFQGVWFFIWNIGKAPARHNYMVILFWVIPVGILSGLRNVPLLSSFFSSSKKLISVLIIIIAGESLLWAYPPQVKFWLPTPVVPLVRKDYSEILKLASDLKELTKGKDSILVAGSSGILNEGVLADAEVQLNGSSTRILKIIGIFHADSYRHIPIKEVLDADWVVVPTPFQWHMHPTVQQCVQVLHDLFVEHWEMSLDFEKYPNQYYLADGVRVDLFRRVRKTNELVAGRTETLMRRRILKQDLNEKG